MNKILNFLQWRINQIVISSFLKRKGINFAGIPSFYGRWPGISNKGKMCIGKNCSFQSFRLHQQITVLENAELVIGNNSFINDGVNMCATLSIRIGDHTKIADMTYIYDSDFHEISPDALINQAPVFIGNNVWIGANSIILPGTVIGDNSVIAAGSIVNGEIPEKCLAVGSPARVIKKLNIPDGWFRN